MSRPPLVSVCLACFLAVPSVATVPPKPQPEDDCEHDAEDLTDEFSVLQKAISVQLTTGDRRAGGDDLMHDLSVATPLRVIKSTLRVAPMPTGVVNATSTTALTSTVANATSTLESNGTIPDGGFLYAARNVSIGNTSSDNHAEGRPSSGDELAVKFSGLKLVVMVSCRSIQMAVHNLLLQVHSAMTIEKRLPLVRSVLESTQKDVRNISFNVRDVSQSYKDGLGKVVHGHFGVPFGAFLHAVQAHAEILANTVGFCGRKLKRVNSALVCTDVRHCVLKIEQKMRNLVRTTSGMRSHDLHHDLKDAITTMRPEIKTEVETFMRNATDAIDFLASTLPVVFDELKFGVAQSLEPLCPVRSVPGRKFQSLGQSWVSAFVVALGVAGILFGLLALFCVLRAWCK